MGVIFFLVGLDNSLYKNGEYESQKKKDFIFDGIYTHKYSFVDLNFFPS